MLEKFEKVVFTLKMQQKLWPASEVSIFGLMMKSDENKTGYFLWSDDEVELLLLNLAIK